MDIGQPKLTQWINKLLLLYTLLLLIPAFAYAQTTKVVRVIDGDTYVISSGEKVRMLGIDAPEMNTYFGNDAKLYLKHLIEGKTIRIKDDIMNQDKDRYGRLLRYTYLNNQDINLRMVCDGYAIAYTRFKFSKKSSYTHCQSTATQDKLGMWATKGAEKLFKQKKEKKKSKNKTSNKDNNNSNPISTEQVLWYALAILGSIIVVYAKARLKRR